MANVLSPCFKAWQVCTTDWSMVLDAYDSVYFSLFLSFFQSTQKCKKAVCRVFLRQLKNCKSFAVVPTIIYGKLKKSVVPLLHSLASMHVWLVYDNRCLWFCLFSPFLSFFFNRPRNGRRRCIEFSFDISLSTKKYKTSKLGGGAPRHLA
jgi:hypothetical protein